MVVSTKPWTPERLAELRRETEGLGKIEPIEEFDFGN